jgi:hypothetical protein
LSLGRGPEYRLVVFFQYGNIEIYIFGMDHKPRNPPLSAHECGADFRYKFLESVTFLGALSNESVQEGSMSRRMDEFMEFHTLEIFRRNKLFLVDEINGVFLDVVKAASVRGQLDRDAVPIGHLGDLRLCFVQGEQLVKLLVFLGEVFDLVEVEHHADLFEVGAAYLIFLGVIPGSVGPPNALGLVLPFPGNETIGVINRLAGLSGLVVGATGSIIR